MTAQLTVEAPVSGCAIIRVAGEIDLDEAPALRAALMGSLASGPNRVVADLSDVTFMDSSGLAALIEVNRAFAAASAHLRLVLSEPRVLRVFELTNLHTVFAIFGSLDAALVNWPAATTQ
jgi:anti-sigma B factor antagonist